jgi:hypothetical protein
MSDIAVPFLPLRPSSLAPPLAHAICHAPGAARVVHPGVGAADLHVHQDHDRQLVLREQVRRPPAAARLGVEYTGESETVVRLVPQE